MVTAERWCNMCQPQFIFQALCTYAHCSEKGNTYNDFWQCLVREEDFHRLHQRPGPSTSVFSTRLLERLICRLPKKVSEAILSVDMSAYMSYKEYLKAIDIALKDLRYFRAQTASGSVKMVKEKFSAFMSTESTDTETASILAEAQYYICGVCKIGLISGFLRGVSCCHEFCLFKYDSEKNRQESIVVANYRREHYVPIVAVPITARVQQKRNRVQAKKEKPQASKPAPARLRGADIYGNAPYAEADVRAKMQLSKNSPEEFQGYYNYHQNLLAQHDRESSCFPGRQQDATGWFQPDYSTPGVTWIKRSEFFHYIAPMMLQMAVAKLRWKGFDQLNADDRRAVVAVCMLDEVDPELWEQFSNFRAIHSMFEFMRPKFFETFVQFVLVCRAVECICDIVPLEKESPMFFVGFRETMRAYFCEIKTVVSYPMWQKQESYNHWEEYLAFLEQSEFGKENPKFVTLLAKKKDTIYERLNTYSRAELKIIRALIAQLPVMQKKPATAEKKLLIHYLTIQSVPKEENALHHSLLSYYTGSDETSNEDSSDDEEADSQAAEHKTVAGSSALKANDSQSSKSKVLTKDDSRPTQVASSNSQAASKQQQGGPRDKNVAKLRRLSAQVPDDEDAPLSSLLPANSANKAGGLSSPPPPSNAVSPKAAVPAADGFSPLPMSQSSETSATSPLNKLMLAAGLPEVSSSEVQKRQRSPSLQEPLSPTKVAKKGGATPITTRPPRITPKSRQPPTQSDIAKLQRPSPTIAAPTPTGQGDTTPESEGSNGDEQDSSGGTSSQESSEHEETAKPKPKQVPKKGKGRGGNR